MSPDPPPADEPSIASAPTCASDFTPHGPPEDEPSSALVELPGYDILGELGRGGMGVVYKARQLHLDRLVAIKFLLAGSHASREAVLRFEHEARTVGRLQHPNIVQIHEVGTHAGRPFLVLEYVEGGSLSLRVAGVPQAPRLAARLVETIARAVGHAHDHGVIHRDLKPGNVLLTTDGVPRITDFGLALEQSADRLTATGAILGTPGYMAPEQASEKGGTITPATDVYALGAILFDLLTGRPPFLDANPVEAILQTVTAEPLPPSRLKRDVPRDLDTITLKCLKKEPAHRYPTAAALADDLRRFLADEPIRARPTGILGRSWRWGKRHPAAAALVAVVQLALVTLVLGGVWSNRRVSQALRDTEGEREQAVEARDTADRARQDAEAARAEAMARRDEALAEAYRARFSETKALRLASPTGWRYEALRKLQDLVALPTAQRDLVALRSEAVACIGGFDAVLVQQLRGHQFPVWSLHFNADGTLLASTDHQSRRVWNLAEARYYRGWTDRGANPARFHDYQSPMPWIRFRPGSNEFAVTSWSRRVSLIDADRGQLGFLRLPTPSFPRGLAYDQRGQLLAVSWIHGQVSLHAADGALRRVIPVSKMRYHLPIALSPDGNWLATAGDDERILLHSIPNRGQPVVLGKHRGTLRDIAFHPRGEVLATCSDDLTIRLTPIHAPDLAVNLVGHTARVAAIAFSPDGNVLASVSDDASLRLWETRTGQQLMAVRPYVGPLLSVAFTPDGTHVAASGTDVFVYRLTTRREQRRLVGHRYMVSDLAFHPTQPLLVSASADRQALLWTLPDGTIRRGWTLEQNQPMHRVAFSPDGRTLVTAPGSYSAVPGTTFHLDLWNVETGHREGRLVGPTGPAGALAFTPSGGTLAAGTDTGQVLVYDVATKAIRHQWKTSHPHLVGLHFTSDDTLLAAPYGQPPTLLAARDGKVIRPSPTAIQTSCLAVAPDGTLVVGTTRGEVLSLDRDTLATRATLPAGHSGHVMAVAVSPTGHLLATGGPAGHGHSVILWDRVAGRKLFELPWPNSVHALAFDRDGLQLAIGGVDELITLWNFALVRPDLAALGLDWGKDVLAATPKRAAPTVQLITLPPATTASREVTALGRTAANLRSLQHRLRQTPTNKELYLQVGRAQSLLGRHADAARSYEHHLGLCRDCAVALGELGQVRVSLGEYDEAVRVFRRCQDAHPTRAEPCYHLAWLFAQGPEQWRDPEQAVLLARRAVALAPTDVTAAVMLGAVYHRLGHHEQAVEVLAKLSPGVPVAASLGRLWLALSHAQSGKHELAMRAFGEASPWWRDEAASGALVRVWEQCHAEAVERLKPPPAAALDLDDRLVRGRALARLERWADAAPDLVEVARHRPTDGTATELAGRACAHLDRPAEAADHFARALSRTNWDSSAVYADVVTWPETFDRLAKLRPADDRLWLSRARHSVARGDWEAASADYARLSATRPVTIDVGEQAAVLLLLGRKAEFARLQERLSNQLDAQPKPATLPLLWTLCLSDKPLGGTGRLEAGANQFLTRGPLTPATAPYLALVYHRLGKPEKARSCLAQAGRTATDDGVVLSLLLQALIEPTETDARAALDKARAWLEQRKPPAGEPAGVDPVPLLVSELLRREAEAKLGAGDGSPPTD